MPIAPFTRQHISDSFNKRHSALVKKGSSLSAFPFLSRIFLSLSYLFCFAFLLQPDSAQAQNRTPWVVTVPGGTGLTNMLYECVLHYQSQGLSTSQAVGQCMAISTIRHGHGSGFSMNSGFMTGNAGNGASAVHCGSLGLDPSLSRIPREPNASFPWMDKPLPGFKDPFDVNYENYMQTVEMLMLEFTQQIEALRTQMKNTTDPVQKQVLQSQIDSLDDLVGALFDQTALDWYRDRLKEYEEAKKNPPSEPGDFPLPDPEAPQYADVSSDAVSACENLTVFIHDCSLSGWKTSPCQMFLENLKGCGDPTITDPSPDEERPCMSKPIGRAEAKEVAFQICSKDKMPVGPDADVCSGVLGTGIAYQFGYGKRGPNSPICSNPFAYTTAESCTGSFSVIVGTQRDAESIIAEANRRLGGPIFIVPAPSPLDPKNGGGCAGDPRCSP